jgi:hypothetical protein
MIGEGPDGLAASWRMLAGPVGPAQRLDPSATARKLTFVKKLPPLSDAFRASAMAERQELIDRYREARARADELEAAATEAAAEAERYAQSAREIGELLGLENQLSLVEFGRELRGQRLREVAIDVLQRHFKAGDRVHYRQWLELVTSEGHRVGGKNVNATFLTQVARIGLVQPVGRRTGLYEVRAAA